MTYWRRKYHEMSRKEKWLAGGILFLIVAPLIFFFVNLIMPPSQSFHYRVTVPGHPSFVYYQTDNIEKLNSWMPWLSHTDSIIEKYKEGKYYKFRRFLLENGDTIKIRRTSARPIRHVAYEICLSNDCTVDLSLSFERIADTITRWKIDGTVSAPFWKRIFLPFRKREAFNRMKTAINNFQNYIRSIRYHYTLTYEGDTTFTTRQPYIMKENQVHIMDYALDLNHSLPEVLLFAIKQHIKKPGTKPVVVFFSHAADSIHYMTGLQLADTTRAIPSRYRTYIFPQHIPYKKFQLKGDYIYARLAYYDALDTLRKQGVEFDRRYPYIFEMTVGHTRFPGHPENWRMFIYIPIKKKRLTGSR